jgi:hypothetical protein
MVSRGSSHERAGAQRRRTRLASGHPNTIRVTSPRRRDRVYSPRLSVPAHRQTATTTARPAAHRRCSPTAQSAAADTEAADAPAPPPGIGSAGHSLIAAPSGLGARVVRMPAGQRLEQNRALVRSPAAGWLLWPLVTARDASDDVSHLNGARLLTHAPRQRELLARQGASRPVVVSADAASAGFAPVADNLARAPRGASPSLGIAAGSTPSRP